MKISTKNAPREVRDWLNKVERETGLSKAATIAALIMDNVRKATPKPEPVLPLTPKKPKPHKVA